MRHRLPQGHEFEIKYQQKYVTENSTGYLYSRARIPEAIETWHYDVLYRETYKYLTTDVDWCPIKHDNIIDSI